MTLTLNIPSEIERHLTLKAQEQGLSTEIYILRKLSYKLIIDTVIGVSFVFFLRLFRLQSRILSVCVFSLVHTQHTQLGLIQQ